jgi:hypothetical protein
MCAVNKALIKDKQPSISKDSFCCLTTWQEGVIFQVKTTEHSVGLLEMWCLHALHFSQKVLQILYVVHPPFLHCIMFCLSSFSQKLHQKAACACSEAFFKECSCVCK